MGDRLLLDPRLAPALADAGLTSVERILSLGGDPTASSVQTWVELPVVGTSGRFYLKRYRYDGWGRSRHLVGRGTLFGTAPEIRAFKNLAWLKEHEVPAVRPILALARTRHRRLVAQVLMTEAVPDAPDLARRLATPGDPVREDARTRRHVLASIGLHLARMHAEGFVHGDAYARNVLVRVADEDVRIFFLDCRRGGTGLWGRGPHDDLATLDTDLAGRVPATDRLRGLKAWLPEDEPSRPTHEKIVRLAERVRRHDAQRQRRREEREA